MEKSLDKNNLPKHVAVIMDGNGRWAKKQGAARVFGHRNAIKSVRDTVEGCAELGISHLTLYAFSTENWGRPQMEVDALMQLLVSTIQSEMKTLMENDVRLSSIGDTGKLPGKCYKELESAKEQTSKNKGLNLILALNYSGKWDLVQACKKILNESKNAEFDPNTLTDQDFEGYLSTVGIPDPELLIRTSGEYRISNFMLWQLAYTELYITDVLWPDFRKEHLNEALLNYQSRERRFGKVLSE
jgi:undecaprenyl diphosphate synthase